MLPNFNHTKVLFCSKVKVQECPRKVLDSGHVNISTSLQLNFLGAVFLRSQHYIWRKWILAQTMEVNFLWKGLGDAGFTQVYKTRNILERQTEIEKCSGMCRSSDGWLWGWVPGFRQVVSVGKPLWTDSEELLYIREGGGPPYMKGAS